MNRNDKVRIHQLKNDSRESIEMKIQNFWNEFLITTGRDERTNYFEAFYFGHTERIANELLALVLQGAKTATTSGVFQYELTGSPYPKVGDLSIVTDFDGEPKCVIETKQVTFLKFSEMTYELCRREGEDEHLASWQNNHIVFFSEIGKEYDFLFSDEMGIVFEEFQVIYQRA